MTLQLWMDHFLIYNTLNVHYNIADLCHEAGTLGLNSSCFSCASDATKLEVSNDGNFVILEVDGSNGLVVSLESKDMEEVIGGDLRLAVGGILINPKEMAVQVQLVCSVQSPKLFCDDWLHISSAFLYNICLRFKGALHQNVEFSHELRGSGTSFLHF